MVYVPFFTRLNIAEYVALISSFMVVGLEAFIRILTLALPSSIISILYAASRRLFNITSSSRNHRSNTKHSNISTSIRKAADFVELCALFGYYVEEHVVQTGDGYVLGIHRLAWKKGEKVQPVNDGVKGLQKNVVYLHHGLLMCSEVWVCLTEEQRCLPFRLVERGYDVWLGNNRGNKYSKKNLYLSPSKIPFWEFSMDQFAFYDIPDTIQYILDTTSVKSLSYIGFSQGTAQAFATLAVHPKLNKQVNVFIGLAPAMSPAGLSNIIVDTLIKASPQVLFLLFGRHSILSSVITWQTILYPPIFCRLVDAALSFLFDWKVRNISFSQKLAAYHHLYSLTSTKSVVHWFQIIRNKSFQMYDDQSRVLPLATSDRSTKVTRFPTRNIKSPIYLLYGGSDSLVDIDVMLRELPSHTVAIQIPHYEHLDFLWAREVDKLVFPHIFDALDNFCDSKNSLELFSEADHLCHTPQNGCERPTSIDMISDGESKRPNSSDTYSTQFESKGNMLLQRNFETPASKIFQDCNQCEPDGRVSQIALTGTPTSAIFQSNLPRPSCNGRKRTRVQKDFTDVSEESCRSLSPGRAVDELLERKQSNLMALDGQSDNSCSTTENNNMFYSKKNSISDDKLFVGKALSVNGYLNDIDVRNNINRKYITDGGRTSEKKRNTQVRKPNYITFK